MMRNAYRTCVVCNHYLERRFGVLAPAVALRSFIRGVSGEVVAHEYMTRVHERHIGGGSLSTRVHTPVVDEADGGRQVRVQRSCNGCGESLGDATSDELGAAVDGQCLPDVRIECGCYGRAGVEVPV